MALNIHNTALVSNLAKLGVNVKVGAYSIIHDNVIIGDGSEVCSFSELGIKTPVGDGSPLIIGKNSLIRSHAVFYESSVFGDNLITGHNVIVREMTVTGSHFQIGTKTEIQGNCVIGNFVRFQSNVFVSKFTTIGNFVWVFPCVIFANDPTPPSDYLIGAHIEDFASISAGAVILPGVTVGAHSVVAASACVTRDVPSGFVAVGNPAKSVKLASKILRRDGSNSSAYPWTNHFERGYPKNVIKSWREADKFNNPLDLCKVLELPKIADPRGNLSYIEGSTHIPFDIKRVYYLYEVPEGAERGGHAHKELSQLIIAISGSFDVHLDDGHSKKTLKLNRSYQGLYICPMVWRTIDNFSTGAVCLVVASSRYEEIDYYRSYDEFLNEVTN